VASNNDRKHALAELEATEGRWYEAEMHRIRAGILLKRDPADTSRRRSPASVSPALAFGQGRFETGQEPNITLLRTMARPRLISASLDSSAASDHFAQPCRNVTQPGQKAGSSPSSKRSPSRARLPADAHPFA
jgi:hypothetical protein